MLWELKSATFELNTLVRIIQTLGILTRQNRSVQDIIGECVGVQTLFLYLLHKDDEITRWATETMFFIVLNHCDNQNDLLSLIEDHNNLIERIVNLDWKSWQY